MKGPKGALQYVVPDDIVVKLENGAVKVDPREETKRARSMWGTSRTLVSNLVTGVTTAATLWLMTVIGLCLGGGQVLLGTVATALAVFTLQALKTVDHMIPREHRARVVLTCDAARDVRDEAMSRSWLEPDAHARMEDGYEN